MRSGDFGLGVSTNSQNPYSDDDNRNRQQLPPGEMDHRKIEPRRSFHSYIFRQKPEDAVEYEEESESYSLLSRIKQGKVTCACDEYILQHRINLHRMP